MATNNSSIWSTVTTNGSISTPAPVVLDPSKYDLPLGTQVVIGILFLIGFPSGLFGNLLVIFAVTFTSLRQKVANLLILNLAITDVLVSALPMPIYGIYYVFYWPQWDFGRPLCKATLYVMRVCGTMSVLTLVVIAVDRYLAVIRNKRMAGKTRTTMVLCILWLICILSMVYPLLGDGLERVSLGGKEFDLCQKMSGELIEEKAYFATLLMQTVLSAFILLCLFGAYVPMILRIWKSRNIKATDSKVQGKRQNVRAVTMMFAILVAFFISWVPYWIVTLSRLYPTDKEKGVNPSVVLVFYSFAILNSAWNPILYALFSRAFRDAYKQVMSGDMKFSYGSVSYRQTTKMTILKTTKRDKTSSPKVLANQHTIQKNGT